VVHQPEERRRGGSRGVPAIVKKLALLLSSLLLAAVIVEIGIRLVCPQPMRAFRFSTNTWYEPIPGARFTSQREEYKHRIRYNSQGLRDHELTYEKPRDVIRIAVVGDSFTEALHVALEETVCEQLEEMLNRSLGAPRVEVINLGVGGFGTIQTLKRLQRDGFRYAPDWVLYLAHGNDFPENVSSRCRLFYSLDGDELRLRDIEVSRSARAKYAIKDFLKRHLQTFTFVRVVYQSIKSRPAPSEDGAGTSPGPSEAEVQLMRAALKKLKAMCAAHSASLAASMVTPRDPRHPSSCVPCFQALCAEEHIAFVDLTPAFGAAVRKSPPVFYQFDGHWNANGHGVAAEVLCGFFRRVLAGEGDDSQPGS
jgi:hypothetical protein